MIEMKSLSDYHNPRIVRPDGTHTVTRDDLFTTDLLHAKDLVAGKLAVAVDPDDLEREDTELVQPHPSISAPSLAALNAGRSKRAVEVENDRLRELSGRLDTLRGEHETLTGEHETLIADRDRLEAEHDKLLAHAAKLTEENAKLLASAAPKK